MIKKRVQHAAAEEQRTAPLLGSIRILLIIAEERRISVDRKRVEVGGRRLALVLPNSPRSIHPANAAFSATSSLWRLRA